MPDITVPRAFLRNLDPYWQLAVEFQDNVFFPPDGGIHAELLPGLAFTEMPLRPVWLRVGSSPRSESSNNGNGGHSLDPPYPDCPDYSALALAAPVAATYATALHPQDEVVYWPPRDSGARDGYLWILATDPRPVDDDPRYQAAGSLLRARSEWSRRHPGQGATSA